MNVLVTGGAGYIGSITVRQLLKKGHRVVVIDNLVNGHRQALPAGVDLIVADVGDRKKVSRLLQNEKFDGVIHLAGYIESGESMKRPLEFFENNLAKPLVLLQELIDHQVNKFVFSSTAGVYGDAQDLPIKETCPVRPTSYYSWSKYFFEETIRSARVNGLDSIILRYFNAAGATPDGRLGEDHRPETHLIPLVFETVLGKHSEFVIHGGDYPTPDGTGVRDFIHVLDLAEAHARALEALLAGKNGCHVYNVGTGQGRSVKEVIELVKKVTGEDFPVRIGPRRAGDWPSAYADATKISRELGWQAEHSLEKIIQSAWRWHQSHPDGFG